MRSSDAFERLAKRETLRQRRRWELDDHSAFIGIVMKFFVAMAIGWALVVAAHWTWFDEPRWLLLAHTLAFVLMTGYWCAAMVFMRFVRKRMPEMFDESP